MKTYIKTETELINPDAEYYSLNEIRKLFNPPVSYTTIWRWRENGILKLTPYTYGNKMYFHIDEVNEELKRHKQLEK
ncbi:helix-turn-helix domain-containing protein [Aquimarina latercula]|uniref:helix-turn-helix domain-containing protein n=1 Tax=Aquimarina latercula TaxID=987 RepID=UPI00040AD3F5|nr:helix-turn-helix domain-containing protein [Aquimarina latercula]